MRRLSLSHRPVDLKNYHPFYIFLDNEKLLFNGVCCFSHYFLKGLSFIMHHKDSQLRKRTLRMADESQRTFDVSNTVDCNGVIADSVPCVKVQNKS